MSDGKVFKATREIAAKLDSEEIKYSILTGNDSSTVQVKYSGDNFSTLEILFISRDDDNDVSVRVIHICKVPDNKLAPMILAVNECNNKFRYVKFVMDKDRDINLEYDMPLKNNDVGEIAVELLIRIMKIMDEAYPIFMKAMYA